MARGNARAIWRPIPRPPRHLDTPSREPSRVPPLGHHESRTQPGHATWTPRVENPARSRHLDTPSREPSQATPLGHPESKTPNSNRDLDTQKSESRFLFEQRALASVSELAWHPSNYPIIFPFELQFNSRGACFCPTFSYSQTFTVYVLIVHTALHFSSRDSFGPEIALLVLTSLGNTVGCRDLASASSHKVLDFRSHTRI